MARKVSPHPKKSRLVIGFDGGTHNLAGAAILWDGSLRQLKKTYFVERWHKDRPFTEIMVYLAGGHNFVHTTLYELGAPNLTLDSIFLAVEEPWPVGIAGAGKDFQRMKQQAQASGAFIGSLLRYGYQVVEANNSTWKSVVRDDMPEAKGVRKSAEFKWLTKQWAIDNGAPELPDLIRTADGLVDKPETSRAKAAQPSDVYDAWGIAEWLWRQTK